MIWQRLNLLNIERQIKVGRLIMINPVPSQEATSELRTPYSSSNWFRGILRECKNRVVHFITANSARVVRMCIEKSMLVVRST